VCDVVLDVAAILFVLLSADFLHSGTVSHQKRI